MNTRALLSLVCLMASLTTTFAADNTPTVHTGHGLVSGAMLGDVRVFKGLPFAAPPVGDRRWQAPVPPKPWTTPRDATQFAPVCPQDPKPDGFMPAQKNQSEDCLYLNVWSPKAASGLPVMVFLHGGGFSKGSGSQLTYDSPSLARQGVVLVTINYRLGYLGFLCHPGLTAESPRQTCGNYGLLDQIMALQWVQDNIAAFGGDPRRVTIFGESAGAVSVGLLLTSPLAQGLFHRAILESGSVPLHLKSRAELEAKGLALQRKLGIADGPEALAKLRQIPADKLLAPGPREDSLPGRSVGNYLCLDGYVLPEQPAAVMAAGRQARVPVIAGSNADEGTLWSRRLPINTVGKWRLTLRTLLGARSAEAEMLYPVQTDGDVSAALDQLLGEGFVAGARRTARWSAPVEPRTYLYHFTRRNLISERSGLGVFHGSELPYIFGSFSPNLPLAAEDRQLQEAMQGYWTRFAATGDPNGGGAVAWPAYTAAEDRHLTLNLPLQTGQHLRSVQCDLWDAIQSERIAP